MSVDVNQSIYSTPRTGLTAADCDFYHTMDIPGHGPITGQWDLRANLDAYLGGLDFAGKRVLEIGPASGFLTFEMERRGAEVVCFEVSDEIGWDFIPYPDAVLKDRVPKARQHLNRIKNSWWFVREAHQGKARMCYGNVYDLPDDLGTFDIAVLAAVLTHTRSPVSILEQCARRSKTILITEPYDPSVEGAVVCRLDPSALNLDIGTWWHCSTAFYPQFLEVLGFEASQAILHNAKYYRHLGPMYTIVGAKPGVGLPKAPEQASEPLSAPAPSASKKRSRIWPFGSLRP